MRGKRRYKNRLAIDSNRSPTILTNTTKNRFRIDASGIVAKPGADRFLSLPLNLLSANRRLIYLSHMP